MVFVLAGVQTAPMTQTINGPRVGPSDGGPADSLVVFVHGYGANGEDLIGLAPYYQQALPRAAFVSPNAPEQIPGMYGAYQWFGITRLDPVLLAAGAASAAATLDAFLDAELARLGLDASRLALVGFSQGTMMALQVGLRRAAPPVAIVGYSGALVGAERLPAEIKSRPPVLLIHGDADPMVPIQALDAAVAGLTAAGVTVRSHVARGVGHSIDAQGVQLGAAFLAAAYKDLGG
ncbi:Carboxylesterase 2 [Alphaproteobacteria bacterium SO-S41]|nr:Carboxylesterase 2 [Alphaproteobacteria bacterium SO-S41]